MFTSSDSENFFTKKYSVNTFQQLNTFENLKSESYALGNQQASVLAKLFLPALGKQANRKHLQKERIRLANLQTN